MMENNDNNFSNFYGQNLNITTQSTHNINELSNLDIEPISKIDYSNHYICTKCHIFPFIKFCKDRKRIRWTCSCVNNKEILIKDLFNKTNDIFIENSFSNFLSSTTINISNDKDFKDGLLCKEHKLKYESFSRFFFINYCKECKKDKHIINFKDIKINDDKINEIFKKINDNNAYSKEISD